jgi:PAS domain S-box-containing protein
MGLEMSIAHRLYFVLAIMVLLISGELSALWFTIHTLSAVRAYVQGEGLWSKAEKDAAYHLEAYGRTRDPNEYAEYLSFLRVSLGDRQTRLEIGKPKPDRQREYDGLIEGRNAPEDVPGMIDLFTRFGNVSYIALAIEDWTGADELMINFQELAERLHAQVTGSASSAAINATLDRIAGVNARLTVLEDHFSSTLGRGSRWLTDLVLKVLLGAALTVEVTGLVLTLAVTRGITGRLRTMLDAVERVAAGDYRATLDAGRPDEIGRLAAAFDRMTLGIERVAHVGSWDWDIERDLITWSKEAFRLHGPAARNAVPAYADFLAVVHRDDRAGVDRAMQSARTEGGVLTIEYRVPVEGGAVRWLSAEIRAESGAGGKVARVLGITRDATARRLAEAAVADSARQYRSLAELMPQIVWTAERDGSVGYFNQRWYSLTGLSVDESLGWAWTAALHPDDREECAALWRRAIAASSSYERNYRVRRRDETHCWMLVRAEPFRDAAGSVTKWFGTFTDIDTQRRAYEHEHRVAGAFQRAALPISLPDVPGLRFDGIYEPARADERVGGDWYDALRLSDGRVVISIGDVSGSGLDAAVIMAAMRHVIRGVAQIQPDPVAILDAADRSLKSDHPDGLVTAFVAIFDPVEATLSCACAGHPRPIVRTASGALVELSASGLPLGLRSRGEGAPHVAVIPAGAMMIFYTDGLTESSRDPVEGERRLRELLSSERVLTRNPSRTIFDLLLHDGAHDDVAILTVQFAN